MQQDSRNVNDDYRKNDEGGFRWLKASSRSLVKPRPAIGASELHGLALDILKNTRGERACILGEIDRAPFSRVVARSSYGGTRVVDMLIGDPLPRIC